MPPSISFAEALAAAVKVEETGMAFYKAAALNAVDPSAAEMFGKLAGLEAQHKAYFAGLSGRQERESLFLNDPRSEFAAGLAAMAANGVFDMNRNIGEFFTGRETPRAVIKTAIGMEKDSIVFYLGLEQAMADRAEAQKLMEIIREEMRHISVLSGILTQLGQ